MPLTLAYNRKTTGLPHGDEVPQDGGLKDGVDFVQGLEKRKIL